MKTGVHRYLRRSLSVSSAAILAVALTACAARGGGQLPPDGAAFTGPATFGFSFSCERSSRSTNLHPKAGRLRVQLSYQDHGSNPVGSSFEIHGIVDELDPVVESMICIADEAPPGGNELIFMGRYRLVSPAPEGFPSTCSGGETEATPLCRFEVTVRDNDASGAPRSGDYFQIKLSSETGLVGELDPATVFYTRAGLLSSGNIKVE
jgi:hypothetical protein